MSELVLVAIGVVAGYLFGGIPFGLIVGRVAGTGDVRRVGSGKTGFTNSLRAMGLKWALIVMAGAEVHFLPNSRIIDSTCGKIIANGYTGNFQRILFRGEPVNANSVGSDLAWPVAGAFPLPLATTGAG